MKSVFVRSLRGAPLLLTAFLIFAVAHVALAQDADCNGPRQKWEQVFGDLKNKLQDFTTIQQTPLERLTQKPMIDRNDPKSIARQVSEALNVKEDQLNARRKECRGLQQIEGQTFAEYEECMRSKGVKEKDAKNLAKKRASFLEKISLTLSEVKEVEGKETYAPYTENYQGDPNSRSVNNWGGYQQMYRRWWGQ